MEPLILLKRLRLFQGLEDETLALLASEARMRQCAQGELIFQQGGPAESFFVLVQGAVKLFRSTAEGREQTLYLVEQGEPFCLCTMFFQQSVPVNAQAIIPSLVLAFPGRFLERHARQRPQLLFNILHVLNERLMGSMQMIEDLALRDIQQRMASFLLHSLHRDGASDRVTLSVPRQEVAKILGTTPETISRVLARMVQDGIVAAKGRQIGILDIESLRSLAG